MSIDRREGESLEDYALRKDEELMDLMVSATDEAGLNAAARAMADAIDAQVLLKVARDQGLMGAGEPPEDASREPLTLSRTINATAFVLHGEDGPIVEIWSDGTVKVIREGSEPEAARILWNALQVYMDSDDAYRRGLLRAAEIVNATTFDYEKWDLNSETPPREAFGIGFQAARDYAARAITREADTK